MTRKPPAERPSTYSLTTIPPSGDSGTLGSPPLSVYFPLIPSILYSLRQKWIGFGGKERDATSSPVFSGLATPLLFLSTPPSTPLALEEPLSPLPTTCPAPVGSRPALWSVRRSLDSFPHCPTWSLKVFGARNPRCLHRPISCREAHASRDSSSTTSVGRTRPVGNHSGDP